MYKITSLLYEMGITPTVNENPIAGDFNLGTIHLGLDVYAIRLATLISKV